MSQLALPLQLADHAVFASFHAAGNETLLATLRRLAAGEGGEGCWLWGGVSTGKTHLLQAVCDRAGDQSIYVPLAILGDHLWGYVGIFAAGTVTTIVLGAVSWLWLRRVIGRAAPGTASAGEVVPP